jgi:hypothetical protein
MNYWENFLLQASRKGLKDNSSASTSAATHMIIEYPTDAPSSSEESLFATE